MEYFHMFSIPRVLFELETECTDTLWLHDHNQVLSSFFFVGVKCIDRNGKEVLYDYEDPINNAVFPGLQGGPHNGAIAAIAHAMDKASTPAFKKYQETVIANAQALAGHLQDLGYKIVTGGTDNHIVLVDLSSKKLSGSKAERILEEVGISVNKNTVPGDKSAMNPSGIRFGTPPLTTRNIKPNQMLTVVEFIHQAWNLALDIQRVSGPKLADWKIQLEQHRGAIKELKDKIEAFAVQFPLPGHDDI